MGNKNRDSSAIIINSMNKMIEMGKISEPNKRTTRDVRSNTII